MVGISGPERVMPGTTHAFSLTITGGQRALGGLDVSGDGGTLVGLLGNMDVRESDGEIVHVAPKAADNAGAVVFHFGWTAPDTPGRFMLYGAGNSVDGNGGTSGDAAGTAVFAVAVGDAPPPTDTPTPATTPSPEPTTPSPVPTTPEPTVPTATASPEPSRTPVDGEAHVYLPLNLRRSQMD